jgi:PAS domain S-box-containing protein
MTIRQAPERPATRLFYLIFVVFSAGIVVGSYLYFYYYEKQYRTEVENQLSAVAQLRAGELAQWRQERLADAAVCYRNVAFAAMVRRFFEKPEDAETQVQLRAWLGHFQKGGQYDAVSLLDAQYLTKLSVPDRRERSASFVSPDVAAIAQSGKTAFEDFYWNDENRRVYLTVLVPIFIEPDGNRPIGFLALRIDPTIHLYPFIKLWPLPRRTAETLLVRREGNEVVYVSELKFKAGQDLKLRVPLERRDVLAVKAVVGQVGIVEGVDYRNEPSIAAVRAIPDSPWFLVARMDTAEVYGPTRRRLLAVAVVVALLLGGSALGTGLIWRRRDARFYRQQRESAVALRESEKKFRLLVENARDVVLSLTPGGIVTYCSPTIVAFAGYDVGEVIGQHIRGYFADPRQFEQTIALLAEGVEMKEARTAEFLFRPKRGAPFWVEVVSKPLAEGDRVTAVHAIMRDITERMRAEEDLRESESKLKAITTSTQNAILMIDSAGKVTYWNPAAETILGFSNAEAIGRNLHRLIAPQRHHDAHDAAFPEFQRSGQGAAVGKTLELQARRKDGVEIPVSLSLSSVEVKGAWHAVGILRDISAQKRSEEALRRTTERANQMAVEAQAANIAKSQFLANMSHEIRTPMNGVIGMTGLLMDTDLSEEQRRYADTIRSSGEALMVVINDILDYSKIEADKLELETLDFDLRVMMEDAAELLALRAHEKGLEFICRIDPAAPTFLRGDPGRLRQILVNLGGNAIKFTQKGEVEIEVKPESESEDRFTARFVVRDTGVGIPADKIDLLFNAFQQLDASTTRQFGGTGLGLAISKRLAEQMGGEIGVESVEGRGATFWFTAVFGKQPPREDRPDAPRADIRGMRILAVDDNATNRLVLAEQLASWGARHAEAASAAEAIKLLRAAHAAGDPFRIVITDMQMPTMDGEALGQTVKADPELHDALLVMMTSLGRRGDANRLAAIGFSAYLTKPVKQSQLYDCLATILSGRPEAKEAAALVTRHTLSETRRRKVRILLAEDNLTNQQVALSVLDKLGFRADAVANGQEAIQALESGHYDLVFMDVQMPVMDGFEATRAIRAGQTKVGNPRLPIVAMTAHAMKGDRERCLAQGMDDYVAKPIAPQALADALDRWLGQIPELPPAVRAVVKKGGDDDGPPIFDREALVARLMGDEDLVKEIVAGFLDDMPKQVVGLRTCIERSDAESAGRQAHAIKGAAANVGGLALSAAALAIEKSAKAGRVDETAPLLPELERQFQLLKAEMAEGAK